jgi:N-dimethylarginine dimethylaminohydrolase
MHEKYAARNPAVCLLRVQQKSMTNERQAILMCPPRHYGVDYVINPWMKDQLGRTDKALAQRQWDGLRQALSAHARIALVEPQPGLPDMVFTANAGMVRGTTAVVSRFRSLERQGEEPFFRAWFEQNGFAVAAWPQQVFFEGAGDALFDRSEALIWSGWGFRSDSAAAPLLAKTFACEAIPVRLVDPRFYHLDTCLCPLAGGWLMYFPPAFDAVSLAEIERRVPQKKRIAVSEADALQFACNAVDLDGHVIMNGASQALQARLRRAGFTPLLTPLSEFLKAGGTAKCLTLKLREDTTSSAGSG